MQLQVPAARLDDRRALLQQLSSLQRSLDRTGAVEDLDRYRQQAFNVITRGVRDAFDLTREDARTIARYDTARYRIPEQSLRKGTNNAGRIPEFAPYALGKQMLLARRLCEAGCGFVTVTNHGWDMHGNAFGIDDGIPCLGPALDHAVSTFLEDLEQRGLSDQILLVVTGEMGRTPRINNKAGRDHWANICSLLLAGGGLRMGQVIGARIVKAAHGDYTLHGRKPACNRHAHLVRHRPIARCPRSARGTLPRPHHNRADPRTVQLGCVRGQ